MRTGWLIATWLLAWHSPASAQDAALADLAGQIEYAFYIQDSRHLQQALAALQPQVQAGNEADLWLRYGQWKLAMLLTKEHPDQAVPAAERCADAELPAKAPVRARALGTALQAACEESLALVRPVRGVLHRREARRHLAQALEWGKAMAQVRLVAGWIALQEDQLQDAYGQLEQATLFYDADQRTNRDALGQWGQAELNYLLGQAEMKLKHPLAARNALEKALVLVPDYRDAAALMKTLSVR